ncbi:MAG: hypothetical protein U1F16_06660 [Turneriella sp.]
MRRRRYARATLRAPSSPISKVDRLKNTHIPGSAIFVSLGTDDAVGYLLSQKTAFSGRAALFMKEMIERQYNLYLQGFPVYP